MWLTAAATTLISWICWSSPPMSAYVSCGAFSSFITVTIGSVSSERTPTTAWTWIMQTRGSDLRPHSHWYESKHKYGFLYTGQQRLHYIVNSVMCKHYVHVLYSNKEQNNYWQQVFGCSFLLFSWCKRQNVHKNCSYFKVTQNRKEPVLL